MRESLLAPGNGASSNPTGVAPVNGQGRNGRATSNRSSQAATADRTLVDVDTEQAHDQLINSRLAYVSVSRGRKAAHRVFYFSQNKSVGLRDSPAPGAKRSSGFASCRNRRRCSDTSPAVRRKTHLG
jgi:hypothetical protein